MEGGGSQQCTPRAGPLPQAYDKLRDDPRVQQLAESISNYQILTESFWMIDAQVETIPEMKNYESEKKTVYMLFARKCVTRPGPRGTRGSGGRVYE